jgi:uncharacterized OsmC-like protein
MTIERSVLLILRAQSSAGVTTSATCCPTRSGSVDEDTAVTGGSLIENPDEIRRVVAERVDGAESGTGTLSCFRASAALVRNLTVETRAGRFTIVIDESVSFAGAGLGPNPLEAMLAGVASCLAVTAAVNAALLGIGIRRLQVDVRADVDLAGFYGMTDEQKGFERLVCEIALETDAGEEKAGELARLAETRCPALGATRLPVPVETRWRVSAEG